MTKVGFLNFDGPGVITDGKSMRAVQWQRIDLDKS